MPVPAPIRMTGISPFAGRKTGLRRRKAWTDVAGFEIEELAGTEAACVFAHADLDKAVAAGGSEGVKAWQIGTCGQDAKQVTGGEAGKVATQEAVEEGDLGQSEAQDGGGGLDLGPVVVPCDQAKVFGWRGARSGG